MTVERFLLVNGPLKLKNKFLQTQLCKSIVEFFVRILHHEDKAIKLGVKLIRIINNILITSTHFSYR